MKQPPKKSRTRKKADSERQNRILEAAQGIFAEKGFIKTTLSDIAARSGVPEASIYDLFSNKVDILARLAGQFFTELRNNLHLHFLGVEGVVNRFRKLIWHHLHYFQEHAEFCRVFVLEIMHNPRFSRSGSCPALADYRLELDSILREGTRNGAFGQHIDIRLCEALIFGAMNHMMLSKTVLGKQLDFVQHAEDLYALFFNAISSASYPCRETITTETGKRKSILVAAMEEFVLSGFQQSTISRIARRAQVTEPTIYEHFTSKEELLYAIPRITMKDGLLVKTIDEDLKNLNTPVDRLRKFMSFHIRSVRNHADYYYLLVSELRGNIGFYGSTCYQSMRDYSERLTWILQQGIESGDFRKDLNMMSVRDLFFGLMDELIIALFVEKRIHEITRAFEDIFDLIFNAIRR